MSLTYGLQYPKDSQMRCFEIQPLCENQRIGAFLCHISEINLLCAETCSFLYRNSTVHLKGGKQYSPPRCQLESVKGKWRGKNDTSSKARMHVCQEQHPKIQLQM